jgi:hypothetical protein
MTIFKKASGHKKKKSWLKTGVKKPELLIPMKSTEVIIDYQYIRTEKTCQ